MYLRGLVGKKYFSYDYGHMTVIKVSHVFQEVTLQIDHDGSTFIRPLRYLKKFEYLPGNHVKTARIIIVGLLALCTIILLTW